MVPTSPLPGGPIAPRTAGSRGGGAGQASEQRSVRGMLRAEDRARVLGDVPPARPHIGQDQAVDRLWGAQGGEEGDDGAS